MTKNGVERSFTVATEGKLLSVQVLLADTPGAVQKAIRAQGGKRHFKRIDKNTEEEEIAYDVEAQKMARRFRSALIRTESLSTGD